MERMKTSKDLIQELIEAGKSQTEIACLLSVSASLVCRILNGEVTDTTYQVGKRLEQLVKTAHRKR